MYKAACHVHSDWSYDGKWPLAKLREAFAQRGYQVLLMTEHDRGFTEARWREYQDACAAASSPETLLIPGLEYSDPTNTIHILVWGDLPFLGESLETGRLLSMVSEGKGIAVLAHPSRRNAWQRFDPAWSSHLLGIEVWNRKTDGWAPSRDARPLLQGRALKEFVGLDFHDRNQFFPLSLLLNSARPVERQPALAALAAGDFAPQAFGMGMSFASRAAALLSGAEFLRRFVATLIRRRRRPALA